MCVCFHQHFLTRWIVIYLEHYVLKSVVIVLIPQGSYSLEKALNFGGCLKKAIKLHGRPVNLI